MLKRQRKTKVKLSKKTSKIEVNPDVDMGVFSGGNKARPGNLTLKELYHYEKL